MIYCTQCGGQNDDGSKFCRNCGAKLAEAVAAPEVVTENNTQTEAAYSQESASAASAPAEQEITINYGADQSSFSSNTYESSYGGSAYDSQHQYYSTMPVEEPKRKGGYIGFSIASMVCGILSIICCCLAIYGIILAIAAIVLGIVTLCFKYDGKGMAIAGIILGGLGLILAVFWFISVSFGSASTSGILEEFSELYDF